MAGLINQLIDTLNEQATRYEELLGLSREKRDVIIANDVDALQKITNLEHMVISQSQKLDKKRAAITKDIALVLNQNEETLTLESLVALMEGKAEQAPLTAVRTRIKTTLETLASVNAHNATLIENALDYIDYSMNVIRSSLQPGLFADEPQDLRPRIRPSSPGKKP